MTLDNLTQTLRGLGAARLGVMAAVAATTVAFFIYLTSRLATPDMALLYGDLAAQDSGQIVSLLEQMEVPYDVGRDGSQIFVPSDQVGRLRVTMAEEGLPTGGSVGYEIFDRSEGLGTTSFVQNVNHLRALEGELARTIGSIAKVRQARVHLVLPRRELFSRDRQEPTASIIVAMQGNSRLERQQVLAIQHLVAAAVPNLKPNMISIVDSSGALLARGVEGDDAAAAATTTEEMRVAHEGRLARMIEELLERSVGPGNVRAQVSAEMDFDRVTENAEIFDPDGQVVRSAQTVEEESGSLDGQGLPPVTVDGNLPDANLPELDANGSQSSTSRIEETVNYEISKTVKTFVRETGVVRRLSVAVLVNGLATEGVDGTTLYEARSPEELEKLATLARSAVGIDEQRGDTFEIVNMQFADLSGAFEEDAGSAFLGLTETQLMRIAEVLVLGVVAVLVLLLIVRPLVGRVIEGEFDGGARQITDNSAPRPALAGPEGAMVASGSSDGEIVAEEIEQMIDLNKVEGRVRASSVKKIGEIVEKHPDEAVAIVRSWLYQET